MRPLGSREDRSKHGHLPALQNICTLKTPLGPSEDLCIWSFVRSLFGSLRWEPEPGRFKLAAQKGFSFLSPRGAPHGQHTAGDRASVSLPPLRWGGRAEGDTAARSPRDIRPRLITRCATLSFAECSGSSDIIQL